MISKQGIAKTRKLWMGEEMLEAFKNGRGALTEGNFGKTDQKL